MKTTPIIRRFLITLWKSLFLVTAGILFALSLSAFVTQDWVEVLKRNISPYLQVVYVTLIGFASPGPRYIIYPLLVKLDQFGIHMGVLIALISGQVLIEPSTFFLEAGYFGWRFPVKRLLVSFVLTVAAGIITLFIY